MDQQGREAGVRPQEGIIQVAPLPDPVVQLGNLQADLRQWDTFWEARQQAAATAEGPQSPAATEAAAVRQLLRGLIAPRLDQLGAEKSRHLGMFLNLMVPFDAQGGLTEFMLHFFQLAEGTDGKPQYALRNPFERDLYVLYDLYRVKKTQQVIEILRAACEDPERSFPSVFSQQEIATILSSLERVLQLLPAQCLPATHRKGVLPQLSPQFLRARTLLERREEGLLYTFPHVLEKYDYRRFFFLVFFKTGLRAKVGGEEKEFRYDFIQFQVLKHEFMLHWLTGPLRDDPRKYEVYKKYQMHGKTFLELIEEQPDRERSLLQQMSAHALNDMASQVNDAVPDELKVGVVPESRNFGFYHQLKERLTSAVDMVRAPIEALRKQVAEHPDSPVLAEPPLPGQPTPAPPTPASREEIPPQGRWEVTLLKKTQINHPFFQESVGEFNSQLGALRAGMGRRWAPFSAYVSELLDKTPEILTIRRRTPKHEWVMPYRLRWRKGEETTDYLLILGAEAKAKPRGMGYQAREEYAFTPFFVFATDEPGGAYGDSVESRVAAGKTLPVYASAKIVVVGKVMELLEVLKSQ